MKRGTVGWVVFEIYQLVGGQWNFWFRPQKFKQWSKELLDWFSDKYKVNNLIDCTIIESLTKIKNTIKKKEI